jgi:hypothetical protein
MSSKKKIAAVAALLVAYVAPVAAYAQSQSSTLSMSVLSNHREATVPADARGSAEFPAAVGPKAVRSRGLGIEPDLDRLFGRIESR